MYEAEKPMVLSAEVRKTILAVSDALKQAGDAVENAHELLERILAMESEPVEPPVLLPPAWVPPPPPVAEAEPPVPQYDVVQPRPFGSALVMVDAPVPLPDEE